MNWVDGWIDSHVLIQNTKYVRLTNKRFACRSVVANITHGTEEQEISRRYSDPFTQPQ